MHLKYFKNKYSMHLKTYKFLNENHFGKMIFTQIISPQF